MLNNLLDLAGRCGLRRTGAAAPPIDQLPMPRMLLLGAGLGLLLGLPLALVLHHPWAVLPWMAAVAGLAFLGRDLEPLPTDLGLPEMPEPARPPEPSHPEREPLVDLIDIPAGPFPMGSPEGEQGRSRSEGPQHEVNVPAFRMMTTLVTRRLYRGHIEQVPGQWGGAGDDGDLPANNVSWYDAIRFCNALSAAEGLAPCYRIKGADSVSPIPGADGYRLPTEAEWEYAARAGTATPWSFGADGALIRAHAWFSGNSGGKPHPVSKKKPNPWGLFDLHGNLWEWVEDCWHEDYRGAPANGAAWVEEGCPWRVLRGGSFDDPPVNLRSAFRDWDQPVNRSDYDGFRCVRAPSPSD